jgi:hypothetical protein
MVGKPVRCPQCAASFVLRVGERRPSSEAAAAGVKQPAKSSSSPFQSLTATPKQPQVGRKPHSTAAAPKQQARERSRHNRREPSGFPLMVVLVGAFGLLFTVSCLAAGGYYWMRASDSKAGNSNAKVAKAAPPREDAASPKSAAKKNEPTEPTAGPLKAAERNGEEKPAGKPDPNLEPKRELPPEVKPEPKAVVKEPEPAADRPKASDPQQLAFFESKIRPVLVQHCYECHSADAEKAKKLRGGLLLDTRDGLRRGGSSGPALVPGNARQSLLIQALRHEEIQMPPKRKLPDAVIEDFVQWVDKGAADPRTGPAAAVVKRADDGDAAKQHWAFRPLDTSKPPEVEDKAWVRTPIDQFILARLEEAKLKPTAAAAKEKLIRRAYFDLWGLPPAPADIDAFLKDASPDAYSKVIDRLLENDHYGERQARHWLDVVRFAESGGYEFDKDRPNAFHYRDFVIKAFNEDMPYNQFVRWQIAGDLLQPGDFLATSATGFLVAGPFPGQTTAKTNEITRYDHLDDMVSTMGSAMLGLSLGCARCHDHKFEPISQEAYYRLTACLVHTDSAEAKLGPEQVPAFVATEKAGGIAYANEGGQPPVVINAVHFLLRGEPDKKKDVAKPGFIPALMHTPKQEKNWTLPPPELDLPPIHPRVALGSWMTDVRQGAGSLLARVIVNRLWQHHMGRGLVATPNDFGRQGDPPTHPELLDWLADELVRGGWKLKPIHKLIMTSATYRQGSTAPAATLQADPQNRLWSRRPARRLEAEAIRDALLAVSGTLEPTMYGRGTLDQNVPRRSVYLTVKRSLPIPILQLFDAPEPIQSTGARQTTTVAPQALAMMNSPFVRAHAEKLAQRHAPKTADLLPRSIDDVYRAALGRRPTAAEKKTAQTFLAKQAALGRGNLALADYCQVVLCLHEFVYVD